MLMMITGSQGEVKGEGISLNVYVSGKPTDPWDLIPHHEDQADKDEDSPDDYESLAYSTEIHAPCPVELNTLRT
jgi:hypothetical protein